MENEEVIRSMIKKCHLFYGDLLISSEKIIEKYLYFFSGQFSSHEKTTAFAFHTGSVCFDIASVAALMMSCFSYNLLSNDDALRALEIGDMVLFRGERYHWGGITTCSFVENEPSQDYIVLRQDPKGKNGPSITNVLYEKNKHLIRPYFGDSSVTDGRGIRKSKTNRNDFLAYVLEIPENEIPSIFDISVVAIADKNDFIDICQHLRIEYADKKSIQMTDVLPVSYFTGNGEEFQIGKNPSKAEAVIKVVSKVSAARDLVLDKKGNKVIGLLATNTGSLVTDSSEFKDLIRRKSLKFVIVSSQYNAEFSNLVINQYEDATIFACTKELLSTVSTEIESSNVLTYELNRQVRNIVGREMETITVEGCWSWSEYKAIKDRLFIIKQSNWNGEDKDSFVLSTLALLNLFTSAFFTMEKLEKAVREKQINSAVISPEARLLELEDIGERSISMREHCKIIISALEEMYQKIYFRSYKEEKLSELLEGSSCKKIALIVPKAYYADLFERYYQTPIKNSNVTVSTTNRFNANIQYDLIIVVGDVAGKRFDPLQCFASSRIVILLYDCESKLFKYRTKKFVQSERKLNARIMGLKGEGLDEVVTTHIEEPIEELQDETIREFSNLDEFIESAGVFDIRKLLEANSPNGTYIGTAEVNYIGTFVSGEQMLFSKYYSAVLYDRVAQKVTETSPDKLAPGDVLVFTKKNDYTRNIVDLLFDQLLKGKKLTVQVQDAAEKAYYWKEALKEYKATNGLTYRALAHELAKHGSSLQEVSIRQWLDEESHIVGPRDEKVMDIIAKVTQDPYMLADPKGYFEACKIVRHYRREILSLIAQAINDKLSNKVPEAGSVFEAVFEHVELLSEIMELNNIYELDKTAMVSNGLVNRPILETEVLL
ncbi:hypothetical protein OBV_30720 [Oscillibacter valericigenes Sjm18-20]|nr:hypothetical protein OBV_30720 [Oscillibacter valericigenes Sjm18-20]